MTQPVIANEELQRFFIHYEDDSRISVDIHQPGECTPFIETQTTKHLKLSKKLRKRYKDSPIRQQDLYSIRSSMFSPENNTVMQTTEDIVILRREPKNPGEFDDVTEVIGDYTRWLAVDVKPDDGNQTYSFVVPFHGEDSVFTELVEEYRTYDQPVQCSPSDINAIALQLKSVEENMHKVHASDDYTLDVDYFGALCDVDQHSVATLRLANASNINFVVKSIHALILSESALRNVTFTCRPV